MGRRDRDPRPPIELIGTEPSGPTDHHVVTSRRRAGPRPARALLAAVLVLVALVSVGLALGDDGEDAPAVVQERDNRARAALKGRPTTIPTGPVLDEAVGASLLLADGGEAWTLIDLDTGRSERVPITADDPGHVVPVRNGVVVISDGRAVLHPLPAAAPVDLGPGEQVLASGLPEQVWIVDDARGFDGQAAGADARLVDLTGAVLAQVTLPVPYPAAATAEGLLFTRDDQTHLATPVGIEVIAPGPLLAVAAERVLYLACDGPADCRPEAIDLASGTSVPYGLTPDSSRFVVQAVLAADGRLAVTTTASADDPGVLTVFSGDGRVVIEIGDGSLRQRPVWLPSDRGLLVRGGAGRQRVSVGLDGRPQLGPIPALDGSPGVAYVIPR